MKWLLLIPLFLFSACLGKDDTTEATGSSTPDAVTGTTQYWAANPCIGTTVKIAIYSDGTCKQNTGFCVESDCAWVATSATSITFSHTGISSMCLASISQISGGISAGSMTGKGVREDGYSPNTCSFGLVGGTP